MSNMIETERLILRNWTDADVQPMYAINQDPLYHAYARLHGHCSLCKYLSFYAHCVMEYFSGLQGLTSTMCIMDALLGGFP
jgi:hypothetical protein